MPDISNISFYNGAHTGQEIDLGLSLVEQRGGVEDAGTGLVTSGAVFSEVANEIIKVTITGITGTGTTAVTGTITFPSTMAGNTYHPKITAEHEVIKAVFSEPSLITGSATITTAEDSISYSVKVNGTTNLTVYLARIGGSLPST